MIWGTEHARGAGAFAYRIDGARGALRCAFRSARNWYLRLGIVWGRDWEGIRTLRVWHIGVQPEVIYALPGRGRLRGRLDWTRVWATDIVPLFLGLARGNRQGQNWAWRLGMGLPLWQICVGAGDVRWARKARSADHPSRARGDAGGFLIRRKKRE